MAEQGDFTFKKMDAGHKELFSMLIYRPLANFMLNRLFKYLNITPNQISFISLLVIISGSCFFAFASYPAIILGALLLHFGYALDMLDGQYARYKGLSSKFGAWFDSFIDVIKAAFLFFAISCGVYNIENNSSVFYWGFIAMSNIFLAFFVLNTRNKVIEHASFEVKITKKVYIGFEISLYWVITTFTFLNQLYFGLIFLATAGSIFWIKPYISLMRYYKIHKEEIEGSK